MVMVQGINISSMKTTFGDKSIAVLALISGLTISTVAIYYSVAGLVSIFSAAAVPIMVMGVALEVSKLVATVWLKLNWKNAPNFIRGYLLISIVTLMLITSMGIFGFLSKAHSDQSLVSGDVQSRIAIYDEKIKTARENIEADRKQLKQMDEAVDQVMARSKDEKGADKSNAIRKAQSRDRVALAKDIEANQKLIATLNDEAAPIRAEVRKVEAEVGPIKYIAKFIYGDDGANENMLEKAVTWVIIIIVIVFDPLAVILLLASQYSFQWFKQRKEELPWIDVPAEELEEEVEDESPLFDDWEEPTVEEPTPTVVDEHTEIKLTATLAPTPDISNVNIEKAHVRAFGINPFEEPTPTVEPTLTPEPDFTEDDAAAEAAKWAQEQLEKRTQDISDVERPGDYLSESDSKKKVSWFEMEEGQQVRKSKEI